jgi:hypothetical protein
MWLVKWAFPIPTVCSMHPFGAKASSGQLAPLISRVDVCASNDMTAALFGTLSTPALAYQRF